jgi:hypothetical protein
VDTYQKSLARRNRGGRQKLNKRCQGMHNSLPALHDLRAGHCESSLRGTLRHVCCPPATSTPIADTTSAHTIIQVERACNPNNSRFEWCRKKTNAKPANATSV